jgi:flagellar biosynthetic protein FliQ
MNPQFVIDLLQDAFRIGLELSLPMMLATLSVGVSVSIFQSITSIQEQTLSFVPKILAVFGTVIVAFSWMLHVMMDFTTELLNSIPTIVR